MPGILLWLNMETWGSLELCSYDKWSVSAFYYVLTMNIKLLHLVALFSFVSSSSRFDLLNIPFKAICYILSVVVSFGSVWVYSKLWLPHAFLTPCLYITERRECRWSGHGTGYWWAWMSSHFRPFFPSPISFREQVTAQSGLLPARLIRVCRTPKLFACGGHGFE